METFGKRENVAKRSVAVITGARSDYGPLVPLLRAIQCDQNLQLQVWVTGSHLSPIFGSTIDEIENDGFGVDERVDMLLSSDTPVGISKSMGVGVLGFAQAYERNRPDIVVGLGDRYELLTAVQAALPFNIPVAHISGGEVTEGVMDESIRHAVTKLSHLHFVATEPYARRVIRMGEEPWRVHVTGEPGLDNLASMIFLDIEALERRIGMPVDPRMLLVTFHPLTLSGGQTRDQIDELLAALDAVSAPVLFTYPNSDTDGTVIVDAVRRYVASHRNSRLVASLGRLAYCSLMRHVAAMVGNSSSGIIEAASFDLPVVNVGSRQEGRIHGPNVVNCEPVCGVIVEAIRKATMPQFRDLIRGVLNPYGDGHASERIVQVLKTVPLGRELIVKRFHDGP